MTQIFRLAAVTATVTATAFGLATLAGVALADQPARTATDAAASATAPVVTMTDGVISPQTVEVPAGKAVTLTVTNAGKSPAEFESKRLHIEQVVAPGTSVEIALRALPAGSYAFVDEFHENLATGRGEIVAK